MKRLYFLLRFTNSKDIFLDFIYFILRKCLKPIIKNIWISDVKGINHIPEKGGVILAMNHQSYFDFLCLAAISPRNIHFLAAEKFFDHILWRFLMKITRQVKVNRKDSNKSEVHRLIHDHLDKGRVVGIFPEGTRSPHEHEMLRAFNGVSQYSLTKRVPIIPIGIKGTFNVMSRHDKRPRFIKAVEIIIGKQIHFTEYYDRNDLSHIDYGAVTHRVMKEISLLSAKKYLYEP